MKTRLKKILRSILFYLIIFVGGHLLWCLFAMELRIIDGNVIPSPLFVLTEAWLFIWKNQNSFWSQLGETLIRLFTGYVLSVLFAVLLTGLMRVCKFFRDDIRAVLSGIQTLPNICWVPFAIILYGLDENAIYFVMVLGAAPAIALALESSIRNIDPIYIKAGKTLGCNKIGMWTRVYIPAAMPSFISGLKSGWAFSWRALMAGEMNLLFSATSMGLGYLMYNLRFNGDLKKVLFIMVVLILIGVFFEKVLFGIAENKILTKRGIKRENEG